MEAILDVSKGLHQDYPKISQPAGTYIHMLNGIRLLSGAVMTERGSLNIPSFTDRGHTILGSLVLDRDIIILSKGLVDEIGVLDKDDIYTIIKQGEFGFQLGSYIDIVGRKNYKDHRIIYFVDGVNPMRTVDLDDAELLNSPTFLQDIQLQLNNKMANVTFDSVGIDGSVKSGVYQFGVRSITATGNRTPFGYLSPLIPIVDETYIDDWSQVDGVPPQSPTNKSIKLTISNLDIAFPFAEVVMITYTGDANIQVATVVGTFQVTEEVRTFTYKGEEQHKEIIELEDITVKPVIYDTATSIEQKDNRLILSNLIAAKETVDFQGFANKVVIRYEIEELPLDPGYRDPKIVAEMKGYRRGETYSFAIAPIYRTSQNTVAYHIPAPSTYDLNIPTTNANRIVYPNGFANNGHTDPTRLGTYTSDEEYPIDSGYPDTDPLITFANRVRHHVMPTVAAEPILSADGLSIRVLGIRVDLTNALPLLTDEQKSNLLGFNIIRQLRVGDDERILTQGIVKYHVQFDNKNFPAPFNSPVSTDSGWQSSAEFSNASPKDYVAFYSPETVIYQKDVTNATIITRIGYLHGKAQLLAWKRSDTLNSTGFPSSVFGGVEATISKFDYTINNNSATTLVDYVSNGSPTTSIQSASATYIPAGRSINSNPSVEDGQYSIGTTGITVNNVFNNGYLFLKTVEPLAYLTKTYNYSGSNMPQFLYVGNGNNDDQIYWNGTVAVDGATQSGLINTSTQLYQLERSLTSQYGPVTDAKFIYLATLDYTYSTNAFTNPLIFGGDTFIGKFGVTIQEGVNHRNGNQNYLVSHRAHHYFWVESSINVGYRHFNAAVGTEGEPNYVAGTLPYFPKHTTIWNNDGTSGLLNIDPSLGHSRGYNKQYSFENNAQYFYPRQFLEEIVDAYANRSIYSEQSIEGEQIDMYRVFLPNNYHDIPKDRGPIIDTFVFRNTFYHHTTGSLWRSFFNEQVSQASTAGEVFLGNGGVFSRPSIPIQTVDGGYAGVQGKWGLLTPNGYFFPDARQKKFFKLGEGLEDLTLQGMQDFFNEHLDEDADYSLTYDYLHDRVLLSEAGKWTLSYQTLLKSWTALHSYTPSHYIQRAKENYMQDGVRLHKMNVGPYLTFFDTLFPFELSYVVNNNADIEKVFDNVEVFSEVYNDNGLLNSTKTISTLTATTENFSTGLCNIIVPVTYAASRARPIPGIIKAAKTHGTFRLSIPNNRDAYTGNISDIYPQSRIKGNYATFDLTFIEAKKLLIHTIKTIERVNAG